MATSGIPSLDSAFSPVVMAAADEATRQFYERHPEAGDRYGERGRAYATHDHAYVVAWIQSAVDLDAPDTLRRNLRWLHDLLGARSFPRDWFLESLDIVAAVMLERGMLAEMDAARMVRPVLAEIVETADGQR